MTIALLQSTAANAGAVSTSTLAFGSNVTAGSLLVCHIWDGASGATFSASDNVNGSYHVDTFLGSTPATLAGAICSFAGAAAGATTVTFSVSGGGGQLRALIQEYSGIQTSAALDQVQGATFFTNSTPSSGNTATTTQPNELLVGSTFCANSGTVTAGSGFTIDANSNSNRPAAEWQAVSSTGAYAATFTLGAADGGVTLIATYIAAVAGNTAPIAWAR